MAKILIAEDSATAAALIRRALEPLGHTLVVATDGAEAARHLERERPDLLILDIIMPGVNGFELCRTVRSRPDCEKLPIILVTSMDGESDRFWGLKQGANDYLVKPFDPDELASKVRHYLEPAA